MKTGKNNTFELLKAIKRPELTSSMLLGLFSAYNDPRKKIHSWVKKGILQPIKQGVYIASIDLNLRPYSSEVLGNIIYGPSYISLETALGHYGFIPERVEIVSSICLGNSRKFNTPVGRFEYCHVKETIYPAGIILKEIFSGVFCLFASPEKALLDFIYLREKCGEFRNSKEYFNYLLESYRLDLDTIKATIKIKKIQRLAILYPTRRIKLFCQELKIRLIK